MTSGTEEEGGEGQRQSGRPYANVRVAHRISATQSGKRAAMFGTELKRMFLLLKCNNLLVR
jgi:hypothetical protein